MEVEDEAWLLELSGMAGVGPACMHAHLQCNAPTSIGTPGA